MKGMNLKILKPSRRWIKPGDIFVMQPADGIFVFGRVIRNDVDMLGKAILIYIYRATSDDRSKVPPLDRENLLVSPLMITRSPWSQGYFDTIENRPLEEQDILPVHCFESGSRPPRYYDDYRRELPERVEPCGELVLTLDPGINDRVCRALGIPIAEEQP